MIIRLIPKILTTWILHLNRKTTYAKYIKLYQQIVEKYRNHFLKKVVKSGKKW